MFSSYSFNVVWTYQTRQQATGGVVIVRSHSIRSDFDP
jgi:hypothetical protein